MASPSNTLFSPDDIFNLEKDALDKLKNFQTVYTDYVRCGPDTDPSIKARYTAAGLTQCSNPSKTTDDVDTAKSNAMTALDNLHKALNKYASQTNSDSATNTISRSGENTMFDTSYNRIISDYGEIQSTRQALDAKLSDLYEIGDTKSNFYQRKLMSDSYTKILLTILATSLTVAVFVSMSRK